MPGATPLHELEAYLPRSSVPNIDRDSAAGGFLCTSNYGGTANASPASTRMASITGVDSPTTAAAVIMTQRRNTRGQLERDPLLASGLVRGHTSAAQVVPAASAVIHASWEYRRQHNYSWQTYITVSIKEKQIHTTNDKSNNFLCRLVPTAQILCVTCN